MAERQHDDDAREVVQRKGGPVSHPGVIESARQGFAGSATELPHRKAIEQSYGVDLSHVQAYTGARDACTGMNAEAYTQGSRVAFASENPSLELAAHEAAHVVQQQQGVHLKSNAGQAGDSYEREADAAASRASAGASARDVLTSGDGATRDDGPVQRYTKPDEDPYNGDWRVADDGQMAVHQASPFGGQSAYATPTLIADAAKQLQAATSTISLEAGGMKSKFQDKDGTERELVDVVPVNTKNKTKDLEMELWADCGRSAHTVSGMDKGTGMGGGGTVARYNKGGQSKKGESSRDWMEIQKVKMMIDLFTTQNPWWQLWKSTYETKLDIKTLSAKLEQYNVIKGKWAAEPDEDARTILAGQMGRLAAEMDALSRAEYEKLSPEAKDDFDKQAGINVYADPAIGEAFHMSTGGNEHPDKPEGVGTWNFHWAGVVMKSGGDTMTLENYSVSNYEVQNKEWVFQLYGVGKKGQSFHEEHRDVHKQHGDAPTSMVATRK